MTATHEPNETFEVADDKGTDHSVLVYELHLTARLVLGLFLWPRSWEWTWGHAAGLYRAGGNVFHLGPISLGYYRAPADA